MTSADNAPAGEATVAAKKKSGLTRHLLTAVQLLFTIGLIYLAFRGVDLAETWKALARLSIWSIVACFFTLIIQFVLLAWRWGILLKQFSSQGRFGALLEGVLAERLVNQFIPTTVGGDAARIVALIREGMRPGPAFQSVLFDRGAGLLGIAFLAGVTAPAMLLYTVNTFAVLIPVLLALGAAFGITVVAFAPAALVDRVTALTGSERLTWLIKTGQSMMRSREFYVAVGVISPLIHLLSCLVFILIGISISGPDTLVVYAICAPAILLATAMPITLAGWGLRESTAVTLLTQFSISASDALACSVIYGVIQLLTGLVAGIGLLALQFFRGVDKTPSVQDDTAGKQQ